MDIFIYTLPYTMVLPGDIDNILDVINVFLEQEFEEEFVSRSLSLMNCILLGKNEKLKMKVICSQRLEIVSGFI